MPTNEGDNLVPRLPTVKPVSKQDLVPKLPAVEPASHMRTFRDLSLEIRKVVETIDPKVPDSFKQQAQKAAGFIQLLDQGLGVNDPEIRTFVQQLRGTFFVNSMSWRGPEALPEWLQWNFLLSKGFITDPSPGLTALKSEFNANYQGWFRKWLTELGSYRMLGNVAILNEDPPPCPLPRVCKAYVEERDLIEPVQTNKLTALVRNLKVANFPLGSTKVYDRDLVLYFNADISEFSRAKDVFDGLGIKYRGPGQDVFQVLLDSEGVMKVEVLMSNDRGLGYYDDLSFNPKFYSPAEFFQHYLEICQRAGKNPAVSYLTSFVNFYSKVDLKTPENEKYVEEARIKAGYPVVYRHIPSGGTLAKPLNP